MLWDPVTRVWGACEKRSEDLWQGSEEVDLGRFWSNFVVFGPPETKNGPLTPRFQKVPPKKRPSSYAPAHSQIYNRARRMSIQGFFEFYFGNYRFLSFLVIWRYPHIAPWWDGFLSCFVKKGFGGGPKCHFSSFLERGGPILPHWVFGFWRKYFGWKSFEKWKKSFSKF